MLIPCILHNQKVHIWQSLTAAIKSHFLYNTFISLETHILPYSAFFFPYFFRPGKYLNQIPYFSKPCNMLICCSRNISDYYQLKSVVLLYIFVGILFFRILWWIIFFFKRTAFIWNRNIHCRFWSTLMHPCWIKAINVLCILAAEFQ